MSDLKLYGTAASRTVRSLWMLGELNIPYQHIPTNFRGGENFQPGYLAINPIGQVPAIDDGGFHLRESLAINLYLAKKHSTGRLYPADLQNEALTWQWTLFAATQMEAAIRAWPAGKALPSAASLNNDGHGSDPLAVLARSVELLNQTFAARLYLLGQDFTVADLNLAGTMYRHTDYDWGANTRTADWLHRCLARPPFIAALKQRRDAGGT